eukprot:10416903-Alexandrium_andersonii.AAC.1
MPSLGGAGDVGRLPSGATVWSAVFSGPSVGIRSIGVTVWLTWQLSISGQACTGVSRRCEPFPALPEGSRASDLPHSLPGG